MILHALRKLSHFSWRRAPIFALSVLASLLFVMGSTYSWFTGTDEVENILKTPDFLLAFQIVEVFSPPGTVSPGAIVEKTVNVKNSGDLPGFVRVLVLVEIFSDTGEILQSERGVTFDFDGLNVTDFSPGNTNMWADGGDGYFYYLGELKPGQTTAQPLFDGVEVLLGLGAEYDGAYMKIEIKTEASETVRGKYRDGWWKNGDNPPTDPQLIPIDDILKGLATA